MADASGCRIGHNDQRTGWLPASRVRCAGLRPPLTLTASRNIASFTHSDFSRGFFVEVVAAWADARVFRDGRWRLDDAPPELRPIHHLGGGVFAASGPTVAARMLTGQSG